MENLEQIVKVWKQSKVKKSNVVALKAYEGLAEVAVKNPCELLVALSHFSFDNIIVLVLPLMNDRSKPVSEMCCEAVKKLFKQDKLGQASLGVIKVISGFVKGRNYEVRPEVSLSFFTLIFLFNYKVIFIVSRNVSTDVFI